MATTKIHDFCDDFGFTYDREWAEWELGVGEDDIDREGLEEISFDALKIDDDGMWLRITEGRPKWRNNGAGRWGRPQDCLEATTHNLQEFLFSYFCCLGPGFQVNLDCHVHVRVQKSLGGGLECVDAVRWNRDAESLQLRWAGTSEWFSAMQCLDCDWLSIAELIRELDYSRGLAEAA